MTGNSESTGFLNDALLESVGFSQLIPESLAPWRPLAVDGMLFFLERLPAHRLKAIFAHQMALPHDATAAKRLVTLLSECPTLHKLGQMLARNRQLPAELRRQLQTLESMLPGTPMEQVLARIREELPHLPIVLAEQALAEGSVAVVLPFSYQDSGEVRHGVLKVLKPAIEEKFTEDLAIWLDLGTFLEQRSQSLGLPALDYHHTLDSVRHLLSKEICLQVEQDNLRAAAAFYAEEKRILIPRLLPWCTPKLTAMERIFGEKVTDAKLSQEHRKNLASAMISALVGRPFWSQMKAGVTHADLHAGNLFVTEDGRLAVLDWSLTLCLSKADQESLVSIILGGLTLDAKRIQSAVAALGSIRADDPILNRTVELALDRVVFQRRVPGFEWMLELLDELALHTATGFKNDFVLFRKTWFSLSGVISDLAGEHSPDLQLLDVGLQRFLQEAPERPLAFPESKHFSTHVSNADVLWFCMSSWLTPARYLARFGRRAFKF